MSRTKRSILKDWKENLKSQGDNPGKIENGACYMPLNKVSSLYEKRGLEPDESGYCKGHKSRHDKFISKRLRRILKKETNNIIKDERL